jgi:hypothetical protein
MLTYIPRSLQLVFLIWNIRELVIAILHYRVLKQMVDLGPGYLNLPRGVSVCGLSTDWFSLSYLLGFHI